MTARPHMVRIFAVTAREASDELARQARDLLRSESIGATSRLADLSPNIRAEVRRLRRIARELRAALKVGQA